MQRTFLLVLTFAVAAGVVVGSAPAGEFGIRRAPPPRASRALSGWFNVTAENGWRGRRYMDGDEVFAEEFSSGAQDRIDVWRFYRRGVLTSEERDLNADGKVDFQTRRDPRSGLMESVLRDTTMRGMNDLEIERTGNGRWEIREDRNLDGVTDRILFVAAPNDAFETPGADLAARRDIAGLIPREQWREMWSDDGYTGSITDYFRYNSEGVLGHYGQWNGREIAWRRCAPDFVPPSALATGPAPAYPPPGATAPAAVPAPYAPPAPASAPYAQETIRDPFDLAAGAADADPYAEMYTAVRQPEQYAASPQQQQQPQMQTQQQIQTPEQPRMTRLPTDESSARSVPARMRPPGASASRRPRF